MLHDVLKKVSKTLEEPKTFLQKSCILVFGTFTFFLMAYKKHLGKETHLLDTAEIFTYTKNQIIFDDKEEHKISKKTGDVCNAHFNLMTERNRKIPLDILTRNGRKIRKSYYFDMVIVIFMSEGRILDMVKWWAMKKTSFESW